MGSSFSRTSDQVEKSLNAPCITLVPQLKEAAPLISAADTRTPALQVFTLKDGSQSDKSNSADASPPTSSSADLIEKAADQSAHGLVKDPVSSRTLVRDGNVLWTTIDLPFSRFAEAMRSIKVAVDLNDIVKSSHKVIGFTSALPNEGKSTLAAGLALLIAQAGGRVILVDCDLRNPSLSRTLAPAAKAGFMEVISGKTTIEDAIWWSDPKTNLTFLPTVLKSRVAHTNELLASNATKSLFDELRKRYEYIIVDLSPLAPVVDVRITTHFVRLYICVIEWGRTKIDIVKKALAEAPNVYQNLIGTVLNKADINRLGRYDAHLGKYYHNKHYARYGYSD